MSQGEQPPTAQQVPPQGPPTAGQAPPSGENPNNGTVLALGITGLVLGILALLFSLIPCLGMYAIYPGVLAAIISGIAVYLANSKQTKNGGLAIAALVISLLAVVKGGFEWNRTRQTLNEGKKIFDEAGKEIEQEGKKMLDDMKNKMNQ